MSSQVNNTAQHESGPRTTSEQVTALIARQPFSLASALAFLALFSDLIDLIDFAELSFTEFFQNLILWVQSLSSHLWGSIFSLISLDIPDIVHHYLTMGLIVYGMAFRSTVARFSYYKRKGTYIIISYFFIPVLKKRLFKLSALKWSKFYLLMTVRFFEILIWWPLNIINKLLIMVRHRKSTDPDDIIEIRFSKIYFESFVWVAFILLANYLILLF